MDMAKSTRERLKTHRAKREQDGLKRIELWLHPDDMPQVKNYAARLTARRVISGDAAIQARLNKRLSELERTAKPRKLAHNQESKP